MTEQVNLSLFVVPHLKAKALPTALINALEIEARNLTEPGKFDVHYAMKFETKLCVRWIAFLHNQLDVTPLVAEQIFPPGSVIERVNPIEVMQWSSGDDSSNLVKPFELRDVYVLG